MLLGRNIVRFSSSYGTVEPTGRKETTQHSVNPKSIPTYKHTFRNSILMYYVLYTTLSQNLEKKQDIDTRCFIMTLVNVNRFIHFSPSRQIPENGNGMYRNKDSRLTTHQAEMHCHTLPRVRGVYTAGWEWTQLASSLAQGGFLPHRVRS